MKLLLMMTVLLPLAAQQSDMEKKLEEKLGATLKQTGAPSFSVALVKDGRLAYAKAFGAATVQTRYAVGSISKEFTAAALLLLQEQGKLSLDDKVSKYFPDMTRAGEVSIRQLLNHTAGYEDFAPQDYIIPEWKEPTTPRAVLDRWAKKPLNFDPGTKWQYSNTNYVLAGQIFEKVSGQGLVAFLRERIFQPLGMQSAGDCWEGSSADAQAYTRFALGPPRPVKREAAGWYFAAGELCMTPTDLTKWDVAFLNHQILSGKSYEEFTHDARLADGDYTHYALGLQIGEFNRIPLISHSGEVSGFISYNGIYPTRKGAVVVLTNEDGINLIGPVSSAMAAIAFLPEETPASERATDQVKSMLESFRTGKIDRSLFTSNASSYFTAESLRDIQKSLGGVGKLKSLTRTSESLRGGMTHRNYRAAYEKKTLSLNIYVMPDGKYEQFMIEE
ncbi:MAG TPA: serine hydrolase domain-containing protein [Candidatus Sulfopaludibacter sp.]|jgi:CubicO group peptidase (beta-lactamase class C family)|nr:serine hydrolase domain-containing protein [Candidatus Sulfopaludibacter sp.]